MSLDITFYGPSHEEPCTCECGNCHTRTVRQELFSANITHNLNKMAAEAGIYEVLWRPEEIGITTAGQMIEPLDKGIELLESDPARFERFNASNGWGLYEHFVPFVRRVLEAAREFPEATVEAWR